MNFEVFTLDNTFNSSKEKVSNLLERTLHYVFYGEKPPSNTKKITQLQKKNHFSYLSDYFSDYAENMLPSMVIVENEYYSQDYIADFSNFHAHCHQDYGRMCKRLHFFKNTANTANFDKHYFKAYILSQLTEDEDKSFTSGYLGNIVIKPTPTRYIGKSILVPYPTNTSNEDKRVFWAIRNYRITLFGKKLIIKSLAFQEQDKSVSVCATAALWTIFSKIFPDSYHSDTHRSPSQITQLAGIARNQARVFPSVGLDVDQIIKVINQSFLTCEYFLAEDSDNSYINIERLKSIIFAYSTYKTPIIIITDPKEDKAPGVHAVVAVGYRINEKYEVMARAASLIDGGSKISKLFVHDDQYGPFSRLILHPQVETTDKEYVVQSTWDKPNTALTYIKGMIVPINHRITISFDEIFSIVSELNFVLGKYFELIVERNRTETRNDGLEIGSKIHHDLNLWLSNDYKEEVKKSTGSDSLLKLLTKNMPKFIWVNRIYSFKDLEKVHLFDLIFDATDLKDTIHLIYGYPYQTFIYPFEAFLNSIKSYEGDDETWKKIINTEITLDYLEEINKFLN